MQEKPNAVSCTALQVPEGYTLRTYQPGDEAHWVAVRHQKAPHCPRSQPAPPAPPRGATQSKVALKAAHTELTAQTRRRP